MAHDRDRLAALEPAVGAVLDAEDVEPPRPLTELTQIVQGLDDGLAMLQLVDPHGVRDDLFFDALGLLVESAAALDRERRRETARGRRT